MPATGPGPVSVPCLQRPERPVPDGPSAAGGPHERHRRLPDGREAGDPREPPPLSFRAGLPAFRHAGSEAGVRAGGRRPAVPPGAAHRAGPAVAPLPCLLRSAGPEPDGRKPAVSRPPPEDEPQALFFQRPDARAAGRRPVLHGDRLHVRTLPAEVAGQPLRRVPPAAVPPRSVLVPDRFRRGRGHLLHAGAAGRRARRLAAASPPPVAAGLQAAARAAALRDG